MENTLFFWGPCGHFAAAKMVGRAESLLGTQHNTGEKSTVSETKLVTFILRGTR